MQVALVTTAARQALIARIAQLGLDINAHIAAGLDGHDTHVILNTPFQDLNGTIVAQKTLRIGVTIAGVNAYVLIPAIATVPDSAGSALAATIIPAAVGFTITATSAISGVLTAEPTGGTPPYLYQWPATLGGGLLIASTPTAKTCQYQMTLATEGTFPVTCQVTDSLGTIAVSSPATMTLIEHSTNGDQRWPRPPGGNVQPA